MANWVRYAVYHLPEGALARRGAQWLGWDCVAGRAAVQPACAGLDLAAVTQVARRYGFHATMRAPFRLREGQGAADLADLLAQLCADQPAPSFDAGLSLAELHGFIALVPRRQGAALHALEAHLVAATEPLRAPLSEAEIARRRPESLTPAQRENLSRWGYPYVGREFRFHITLTGPLDDTARARAMAALRQWLPVPSAPYPLASLSLMGEDADGRFHQIARFPLRPAPQAPLPLQSQRFQRASR